MTYKHTEMVKYQAENHWLIQVDNFSTIKDYVQHLKHRKDYEKAATLVRDKRVLDVGCNTGWGSVILRENCQSVMAVDVSERAIAVAVEKYGDRRIEFQVIDGKTLPFDSGSFDAVVSQQVIEHVVDYDNYISEIVRVLTDRGVAIFTTPNSVIRLDPGMKPWNPLHVREFNSSELEELLTRYFETVKLYGLTAVKEVYDIEFARGQRSLRKARARNSLRFRLRARAMEIFPRTFIARLRQLAREDTRESSSLESQGALQEFLEEFSTDDLFYIETDLDQALHLMAVCGPASSFS